LLFTSSAMRAWTSDMGQFLDIDGYDLSMGAGRVKKAAERLF
jgi:hypothetical protein